MIEIDRDRLAATLAELVRIPSINPDLVPGAGGEWEIAAAIADRLSRTPGIVVEMQEAAPGRPNVIASAGSGRGTGRTLMLNGHTDTVGVEGMVEPYSGRVEGNRLYGRGAADMKGALAVMILLLEEVAALDDFPGKLVATFVVDEEYASIGTQAVCAEIHRWQPDAALVLESTGLKLGVAHKGFVWATIETKGLAAHGSRWETGVDAIARMGRVLVELERYGQELTSRPPHPFVGPPSVHASLIRGGQELSSYPASCTLEIERRTVPGETRAQVQAELQAILDQLQEVDPTFQASLTLGIDREPFEVSPEAEVVRRLGTVIEAELGQEPELMGQAGWMDSAFLAAAGVPTAIFGPQGEGAHAEVEWEDLGVLVAFSRLLSDFVWDFCGPGGAGG